MGFTDLILNGINRFQIETLLVGVLPLRIKLSLLLNLAKSVNVILFRILAMVSAECRIAACIVKTVVFESFLNTTAQTGRASAV